MAILSVEEEQDKGRELNGVRKRFAQNERGETWEEKPFGDPSACKIRLSAF